VIKSIRGRLTFAYATVLTIVLGIYAGAAYSFLVHRVYSEMRHTLRADFEAAEVMTHDDHDSDRWIEVRDASGTIIRSTGPGPALPQTVNGVDSYRLANGEYVRVLTGEYKGMTIRVGRSEKHLRQRLGEFLLGLGIALPLAVALLCFAGYSLARRTLAPVDRIVVGQRGTHLCPRCQQVP